MHKSATKCNEIVGKWCKNKHGASKIIDTLETYQLSREGYYFESVTNGCSILKDNIFYVHATDRDGLYIFDLDCNETDISSVDAKRCKLSDDNTPYTW
jgi:hypothetical protein